MIPLTNYDFQWARSELVIIYPGYYLVVHSRNRKWGITPVIGRASTLRFFAVTVVTHLLITRWGEPLGSGWCGCIQTKGTAQPLASLPNYTTNYTPCCLICWVPGILWLLFLIVLFLFILLLFLFPSLFSLPMVIPIFPLLLIVSSFSSLLPVIIASISSVSSFPLISSISSIVSPIIPPLLSSLLFDLTLLAFTILGFAGLDPRSEKKLQALSTVNHE